MFSLLDFSATVMAPINIEMIEQSIKSSMLFELVNQP